MVAVFEMSWSRWRSVRTKTSWSMRLCRGCVLGTGGQVIRWCERTGPAGRRIGRLRTRVAALGVLLPTPHQAEEHKQADEDRDSDEDVHNQLKCMDRTVPSGAYNALYPYGLGAETDDRWGTQPGHIPQRVR